MASEGNEGDALRWHLTGAVSDGAAQGDPGASLGGYRSGTRIPGRGCVVEGGPRNVRVEHVAGAFGAGAGTLRATASGGLELAAPGDAAGAAVAVADGETRVVLSGDVDRWALVSRVSADGLAGAMTLSGVDSFNALFDDVSDAEHAAGGTRYRCVAMRAAGSFEVSGVELYLGLDGTAAQVDAGGYAAGGAITVTAKAAGGFGDWPASGGVWNKTAGEVLCYSERTDDALTVPAAGRDVWSEVGGGAAGSGDDVLEPMALVEIGLEAPSVQPDGDAQTVADEATAPIGIGFVHPTSATDADVLRVAQLESGEIMFLWFARRSIVGLSAAVRSLIRVVTRFEAQRG